MPPLKTKEELMLRVRAGLAHESFEHSQCGMFDITLMRIAALAGDAELISTTMDLKVLEHLTTNYVWEEARVEQLRGASSKQLDPGILVELDEGTHLIIDGAHRILARYRDVGHADFPFPFYLFTERQIIRPPENFGLHPEHDWGDALVDGKIIRRT